MSKASSAEDTLRSEYQRSDFPGGFVRGKYAARAAKSSNIAVLEPEVAAAFPNSAAVNEALRAILNAAKLVSAHSQQGAPADVSASAAPRLKRG